MKIFNSISQTQFEIPSDWKQKKIRLFVCGPTVYDLPHIGHARTYISFDIIARWLRHRGFKVLYLQNITDVDDKIIKRARERNTTPKKLSMQYEKEYHKIEKQIGISSITKYARASDYIPEIIVQIQTLLKKKFAYKTKNGIYFEVSRFKNYGKLSGQKIDKMIAGARIQIDKNKKSPFDFALWKKSDEQPEIKTKKFLLLSGEPMWKSPWGWGRPGWHIEDTAITQKNFGAQYEIHGGASELKFPHHEAEIAQQESVSGKHPLVKLWIHTGVLLINKQKMSKSLGNFITIKKFLDEYNANTLRMMVIEYSYRSPINYTKLIAESAEKNVNSIYGFLNRLCFVQKTQKRNISKDTILIEKYEKEFNIAMDEDMNTPKAMAIIFSIINDTEKIIYKISTNDILSIYTFIFNSLSILGFSNMPKSYKVPSKIKKVLALRKTARNNTQFVKADILRREIERLEYNIYDTPLGSYVQKTNFK